MKYGATLQRGTAETFGSSAIVFLQHCPQRLTSADGLCSEAQYALLVRAAWRGWACSFVTLGEEWNVERQFSLRVRLGLALRSLAGSFLTQGSALRVQANPVAVQ